MAIHLISRRRTQLSRRHRRRGERKGTFACYGMLQIVAHDLDGHLLQAYYQLLESRCTDFKYLGKGGVGKCFFESLSFTTS